MEFLRSNQPKEFSPKPYYSTHGDAVIFFFKDEQSYAERFDQLLTVYRSMESGEMIGCEIKGVRVIMERLGNFGIHIHSDQVDIGLIFLGYLTFKQPEQPTLMQELQQAFGATNAQISTTELAQA